MRGKRWSHVLPRKIPRQSSSTAMCPGTGSTPDYEVYRSETRRWRARHLRVYPALGNHEFSACQESICLERWWGTFTQLRGRRWYSVAIGDKVVGIALDSDASLLPGSDQRSWFEDQVASLDPKVRMVLIVMHHPPRGRRANEQTRRTTIRDRTSNPWPHTSRPRRPRSAARFVVSAGHIHNYERFEKDGVVYLVSGGGGAFPYEVERTVSDLYQNADFPNYHYVRFNCAIES